MNTQAAKMAASFGFLRVAYVLGVPEPSRSRSEASARPWRRKRSISMAGPDLLPPPSPAAGTTYRRRGKDSGRTKRLFHIATSNHAPIAINKGAALHIGC